MPLIGTAGHVDHGKSTLVERLTGRDPDRWDEEKERGLTIDLGFAWTTLPSGTEVSFVDVPGHGRFIKNMLAGIDGFDLALLVVAADEGWSVQTDEHVAALHALGLGRAVVALTKSDLVDDDLLDLAVLEVEERLEPTRLAGAPVVPVSALEGTGIDDLAATLDDALATWEGPAPGPVDLWVDRVFSIPGAGTVATGSLTKGALAVGDRLEALPAGLGATVRGLHQHDTEVAGVVAGGRVAINLAGVDKDDLSRGMRLRAPATALATERLLVTIEAAPGREPPSERGAHHLHLGTGAWAVELRPVEDGVAILTSATAVPATAGDRFVLRDVGRRQVVGGGVVIDPDPPRRRGQNVGHASRLRAEGAPDEMAEALLAVRGADDETHLRRSSGGGTSGTAIGGRRFDPGTLDEAAAALPSIVDEYLTRWPLRPGHPKAELAAVSQVGEAIDLAISRAGLVEIGPWVAPAGHEPVPGPEDAAAISTFLDALEAAGLAPERLDDLTVDPEVLGYLLRAGTVERVGAFVYLRATLDDLMGRLPELGEAWSVSELRDHFAISRKHAVPLVEWLDAEHVTRRTGDVRSLRRREPE